MKCQLFHDKACSKALADVEKRSDFEAHELHAIAHHHALPAV